MKIIDGRKIAKNVEKRVTREVLIYDGTPSLCIFQVGLDPASDVYIRQKVLASERAGIKCKVQKSPEDIPERDFLDEIKGCAEDPEVHGILVQLPLPKHISVEKVIDAIPPGKDVDGFHPLNIGRLTRRSNIPYLLPCTPWGIAHMINNTFPKGIRGKKVVVVGQSHIVGRPLSVMLQNDGATVTMCDKDTKDLLAEYSTADIIITATGVPSLIGPSIDPTVFKHKPVVIDAGISKVKGKIVGDVDEETYSWFSAVSPVPGGVGPVTVAFLLRNVFKAFCIQKGYPLLRQIRASWSIEDVIEDDIKKMKGK